MAGSLLKQNVAAYVRCITSDQQDSPEVQLALLRECCQRENFKIVACYADEGVSGGTEIESRPAFQQLLADRKIKGFDTVVILKIDRFSRDLFDFLSFERAAKAHKLQVIYATETFRTRPCQCQIF